MSISPNITRAEIACELRSLAAGWMLAALIVLIMECFDFI